MISTRWVKHADDIQLGGAELIEQWQNGTGYIWIDIEQGCDESTLDLLRNFGCHELALKDVSRDRHPPKVEWFQEHTFVIFRGLTELRDNLSFTPLQLSLFVGEHYLISIHTRPSLSVNEHQQRTNLSALICNPQKLALSLLHFSAGLFLDAMLNFDSDLVRIEDEMLEHGNDTLLKDLIRCRSQLRKMQRNFDYHETLAKQLIELWDEPEETTDLTHRLRDLYDRCERLATLAAQQYEICGDLVDGYFSITSHELNNTMRILTVVTSIFVPLGFLAGLYGMNFDYIPELHAPNGYFILLGVMATLAVAMIGLFKAKRWF
ncbi:MAG: magnesium transporter CorA family protein [Halieaceae bacterium]|nr:magnesium transporter CorA family protein [Halieaceae bacterium]